MLFPIDNRKSIKKIKILNIQKNNTYLIENTQFYYKIQI